MRIKNNEIISISALISACSCGASVDIFINGESTGVIHINESGGFYKHMLYGTRKKPRTELTL